ncbi:hypothetical protein DER45DRAFT_608947 [Fusarium avenaceum]|nr:hypothetical protein DER45DRAFT_608947 [Fusarium avenaceum]
MSEATTWSFANRIVVGDHELHSAQRNLKDDADGKVLVGQMCQAIDDKSVLELIIDVELLSAEWVFQFSIENDSKGMRTREEETELGMTVTHGKEVSESVSASAGFSGWGFSAQVNASTETKTFTSVETTSVKRIKDTYQCPPEASIFVYKRKYKFKCRPWIYYKAQNAWFNYPDGRKMQAEFVNEITSNQELISPVALSSHGRISGASPAGLVVPAEGYTPSGAIGAIFYTVLLSTYPSWIKK